MEQEEPKIIIHKCDICRKEMITWLFLDVKIGAVADYINVSSLTQYKQKREICERCFDRIMESCKQMEVRPDG